MQLSFVCGFILVGVESTCGYSCSLHVHIILATAVCTDLASLQKVVQTNPICGTPNQRQSLHKCYTWCTQEQLVILQARSVQTAVSLPNCIHTWACNNYDANVCTPANYSYHAHRLALPTPPTSRSTTAKHISHPPNMEPTAIPQPDWNRT